jgi:hypothetical protein
MGICDIPIDADASGIASYLRVRVLLGAPLYR